MKGDIVCPVCGSKNHKNHKEGKMIDKKKQGKKNRKKGAEWEKIVRKDLESKGWIVVKNNNNVEFEDEK